MTVAERNGPQLLAWREVHGIAVLTQRDFRLPLHQDLAPDGDEYLEQG